MNDRGVLLFAVIAVALVAFLLLSVQASYKGRDSDIEQLRRDIRGERPIPVEIVD